MVELQRNQLTCLVILGLAHDINNLLHVVNSSAHLMQMYLKNNVTALRDLEHIEGAAKRATSMLRRSLETLRREPEGRQRISLCRSVSEIQSLLVGLCGTKIAVTADFEIDGGFIIADRVEIDQVLLNLAINARDAMPDGGRLHLRVYGRPSPEKESDTRHQVVLEVSDTGRGMKPEVRRQVFTPFFTTKSQGTGLGLTVTKAIVAGSGGTIELESTEGVGTCFRLVFREAPSSGDTFKHTQGVDGQ